MSLLVCEMCNKAFNSVGAKLCRSCADEIDRAYVKVRRYLYKNPAKKSFASVIEATEVSEKVLSYLIDNGRVVIDIAVGRGAKCIACGTQTGGASLCDKCRAKLIAENLLTTKIPTGKNEVRKPKSTALMNQNNIVKLKRGEKEDED